MKFGIASWGYRKKFASVSDMVGAMAGLGCEALSFLPMQINELDEAGRKGLTGALEKAGIVATVHGSCDTSGDDMETIAAVLGDTMAAMTFDRAMKEDSRGRLYDIERIEAALSAARDATAAAGCPYAMEDLPLDEMALDFFRDSFDQFLDDPRYGILVDLGHIHLRRTQEKYFTARSIREYLEAVPLEIVEVHVHDNKGDKDSHAHIGWGDFDFSEAAAALKDIGFDGISTIEVCPPFHDSTAEESLPHAEASLKQWKELMTN